MRYLGIDYGTKRIGLALSDIEGRMAFPHGVLSNDPDAIFKISELCTRESVQTIVIGESRDYQNRENPIMQKIHPFREVLREATDVPVEFFPEVLSSMEAMRIQGDNAHNDASAAAIVLQSYLDRINPPRPDTVEDE